MAILILHLYHESIITLCIDIATLLKIHLYNIKRYLQALSLTYRNCAIIETAHLQLYMLLYIQTENLAFA